MAVVWTDRVFRQGAMDPWLIEFVLSFVRLSEGLANGNFFDGTGVRCEYYHPLATGVSRTTRDFFALHDVLLAMHENACKIAHERITIFWPNRTPNDISNTSYLVHS